MSESVYIESTIPSYYLAKPSRDIIASARQELTRIWWERHKGRYDLYISQLVVEECARGDPVLSGKRISLISQLPKLLLSDEIISLAGKFVIENIFPAKATDDAFHLAYASVYQLDYLLTWNLRHLANAYVMKRLRLIADKFGVSLL
jgi:hypothetical protein